MRCLAFLAIGAVVNQPYAKATLLSYGDQHLTASLVLVGRRSVIVALQCRVCRTSIVQNSPGSGVFSEY